MSTDEERAEYRAAVARAEARLLRDHFREHGSPFLKALVAIGDKKAARRGRVRAAT